MSPQVVVIVNDTPNYNGGAAKVAIDSAIGLSSRGIRVIFFSSQTLTNEWISNDIELINLDQKDILSNPNRVKAIVQGIYNTKAKEEFAKLLDTLDPKTTILHFHGWTKSLSSSVFKEVNKRNFKIAITLHEYFLFCPNGGLFNYVCNRICSIKPMSMKCILCNCDSRSYAHKIWRVIRQKVQNNIIKKQKNIAYICISDLNKSIAKKYLDKESKIVHLNNPIETNKTRIPHSKYEERPYYLFVGRISPEKGINLFCKAMSNLERKAIVIGDGEDLDWYKKTYKNISFVGWKSKDDMIPYIEKARALIFPSLWYEGAPLTTKEIQSYGIPIIVSNQCAAKEDVIEGITGFSFESGNLDSLTNKIKLFEKSNWNKLSEATLKNFCHEKYTINSHIDNLMKIYNNILKCK